MSLSGGFLLKGCMMNEDFLQPKPQSPSERLKQEAFLAFRYGDLNAGNKLLQMAQMALAQEMNSETLQNNFYAPQYNQSFMGNPSVGYTTFDAVCNPLAPPTRAEPKPASPPDFNTMYNTYRPVSRNTFKKKKH